MRAEIEITAGIIRVFDDGAAFGGPFAEVMYLVGDEGVATIKGLRTERMTRSVWCAVDAELARAGFREAVWHRYKGGRRIAVRFPVKGV